jgi:ankyrin repeat protein
MTSREQAMQAIGNKDYPSFERAVTDIIRLALGNASREPSLYVVANTPRIREREPEPSERQRSDEGAFHLLQDIFVSGDSSSQSQQQRQESLNLPVRYEASPTSGNHNYMIDPGVNIPAYGIDTPLRLRPSQGDDGDESPQPRLLQNMETPERRSFVSQAGQLSRSLTNVETPAPNPVGRRYVSAFPTMVQRNVPYPAPAPTPAHERGESVDVRRSTSRMMYPEEITTMAINAIDERGFALIHHVAEAGTAQMMKLLLKHGADMILQDINDFTALGIAISFDNMEVFDYLFERTIPPIFEIPNKDGLYIIHLAAQTSSTHYMQEILDNKYSDINKYSEGGLLTPLHIAVSEVNEDMVKFLIARGASADFLDAGSASALHYATLKDNIEILKSTAVASHHPHRLSRNGESLLHMVSRASFGEGISYLVEGSFNVNVLDNCGRPAIFSLVSQPKNTYDIVVRIFQGGANGANINNQVNKNIQDRYGNTIMHFLVFHNRKDLMPLFHTPRNMEARNEDNRTPVEEAIVLGRIGCMKRLYELGAMKPSDVEIERLTRKWH